MNSLQTHYPDYNVMDMAREWDAHTREIVEKRRGPFPQLKFLTEKEARYLAIIAEHIVYDNRAEIVEWIVHHFDRKLHSRIGEGQRRVNTPPEKSLLRDGLKALDHVARLLHGKDFGDLQPREQFKILADLQQGKAAQIPEWQVIPQKELFKKLVRETVGAYYSHPVIWSEIGYGGPMYPKSYVRIEFGLTDPWEAKRNGK